MHKSQNGCSVWCSILTIIVFTSILSFAGICYDIKNSQLRSQYDAHDLGQHVFTDHNSHVYICINKHNNDIYTNIKDFSPITLALIAILLSIYFFVRDRKSSYIKDVKDSIDRLHKSISEYTYTDIDQDSKKFTGYEGIGKLKEALDNQCRKGSLNSSNSNLHLFIDLYKMILLKVYNKDRAKHNEELVIYFKSTCNNTYLAYIVFILSLVNNETGICEIIIKNELLLNDDINGDDHKRILCSMIKGYNNAFMKKKYYEYLKSCITINITEIGIGESRIVSDEIPHDCKEKFNTYSKNNPFESGKYLHIKQVDSNQYNLVFLASQL